MRIFLKNYIFAGGAPRSLLEYSKILLDNGHQIITSGEITNDEIVEDYKGEGIDVLNIKSFSRKRLIQNYFIFIRLYYQIKKVKPDLIITVSDLDAAFISLLGKYLRTRVIIIKAGGPNPSSDVLIKYWNNNKLILFSKENERFFLSNNYKKNKIIVISNRINSEVDEHFINHYEDLFYKKSPIKILLITRLDKDKKDSILSTIKLVEYLIQNTYENIKLDIIGDGNEVSYIRQEVELINKKLNCAAITLIGYRKNINEYVLKSHIIIGKGRSVIEPIIMNRIGIVAGENSEFAICTTENFSNLYDYNFSGRNIKYPTPIEEVDNLILSLISGNYNYETIVNVSNITSKYYEVKHLEKYLIPIIEENYKNNNVEYNFKLCRMIVKLSLIQASIIFEFIFRKLSQKIRPIESLVRREK